MFDRPQTGERAILVHVHPSSANIESERAEFGELAASAGANVTSVLTAPRSKPDPRYYVGIGKLDEIAAVIAADAADLVIFNCPLSPAQERNLERRLTCRVLDRIGLILDLFAQRASTFEGKLQVELAQLRHLSTRLVRGWTHLERQKGGIGLRGPGETQLETDRRLVADRIRRIDDRLEGVSQRRAMNRRARRRAGAPVVSLVGYTNAGKSSLFNAMTGAQVLVEDRLFATLDPTLRRVDAGRSARFLLADTVGFIGDLPHELVAAFRSTLEETLSASLLLHVIDVSDPDRHTKIEQVNAVLEDIGAADVPQLEVYNKIDLWAGNGTEPRARAVEVDAANLPIRAWVSARTGAGLEALAAAVAARLNCGDLLMDLRLPFAAGRLRSRLFSEAKVVAEHTDAQRGWELRIEGSHSVIERLRSKYGLDDYAVLRVDSV